ncbi:MAG: polysaccharide lyase [Verrucomicrobiae bacterium]|nr:polysaccharide lyase [Verrucomicrobiae bacterium]
MKNKILITAVLSLVAHCGFARENWPVPGEEIKQRDAAWNQYEQEVIAKVAAQQAGWEKQGKPYIPWAAKPEDLPQAKVPAFPGAEGGGKFSFGGRGGKVFVVTNLADSGPGTLREACESAGPRIVVFNVAGIIHLAKPVYIEAPYITIDGHTAPGDGICIADNGLVDNVHDVVIRYLRFRRGNMDIFNRHGVHYGNPVGNIIIDHVSASWGQDQNIDTYRHMYQPTNGGPALKLPAVNVTIQWTITSEALNTYNHAFGGDWGGRNSGFHHNLFACNAGRNPSIAMTYDFNFANNVLFNWRHRTLDGGDKDSLYNIINNYYKPGPAVNPGPVAYRILLPSATQKKPDLIPYFGKAYVAGNIVEGNEKVSADNWAGGVQFSDGGTKDDPTTSANEAVKTIMAGVRVDKPFPMPPMTITPAKEAYEAVLKGAGDTLPHRDAVDERVINEVRTGKVWSEGKEITPPPMPGLAKNNIGKAGNGIITDVSQVGGYPEYKGEPVKDLGADGIPLSWKKKYGLDTKDVLLAQKDLQGDGYTVMDKYLASLDPTKKIDWSDPRSNVNTLK